MEARLSLSQMIPAWGIWDWDSMGASVVTYKNWYFLKVILYYVDLRGAQGKKNIHPWRGKPRQKTEQEGFLSFPQERQSCGPFLKPSGLGAFCFHYILWHPRMLWNIVLESFLFLLWLVPIVSLLLATKRIPTILSKDNITFRKGKHIFDIHYN